MPIKIISWNIWGGKYLSGVIDLLKREKADIIGLQEAIQNLDGTNNIAEIIADKLGYEWVYAPALQLKASQLALDNEETVEVGNAILSKYKITGNKIHALSENNRRVAIEATIRIKNKNLHMFSTHLIHTHQQASEIQELQAENLSKILPKELAILVGDFNATPESNTIKIIGRPMKNADEDPTRKSWSAYKDGCSICKPPGVIYRLDYIFTTKDLNTVSFTILNSIASDHLPISAVLLI